MNEHPALTTTHSLESSGASTLARTQQGQLSGSGGPRPERAIFFPFIALVSFSGEKKSPLTKGATDLTRAGGSQNGAPAWGWAAEGAAWAAFGVDALPNCQGLLDGVPREAGCFAGF